MFFANHTELSPSIKLFFVTGILGGFTTFSTYNMELVTLLHTGSVLAGAVYFGCNVVGGLLLCWLGHALGTRCFSLGQYETYSYAG